MKAKKPRSSEKNLALVTLMVDHEILLQRLGFPSAFLALLLIGFARAFLIALRWWYWVTHALLGFLSNLASLRALLWALSST